MSRVRGGQAYRNKHQGRVRLDPLAVALTQKADSAQRGCGQQLDGQDGVDLAHKLVADADRGLGDGAAKLEVVGQISIVVAIDARAGRTRKQALVVVVGGGAGARAGLGLIRGRRLGVFEVLIGVDGGGRAVLCRARHGGGVGLTGGDGIMGSRQKESC
jgi:hypothetical protein